MAGQVGELETIIEQSALPLHTSEGCGGDTPVSLPNHTYGWGRVDAWEALNMTVPSMEYWYFPLVVNGP